MIGLFSNADENIGTLTSDGRAPSLQNDWLVATLKQIVAARKPRMPRKALVLATHHPPYNRGLQTGGKGHPGNATMLAQIDNACQLAGAWPDAFLSGHSHNYQLYHRAKSVNGQDRTIPYMIAGTGGIGIQDVSTAIGAQVDGVSYKGGLKAYGYLTVTVSTKQLDILFTMQDESHRAPVHVTSINLQTGQLL